MEIVLLNPQNPGNIGSVARAMKNFGFEDLVLVNPPELGDDAVMMAKHADEVLKEARILDSFDFSEYGYIVGTTGARGDSSGYLHPGEVEISSDTALVFGNEGRGLSNEELDKCDAVVRIPTSEEYPVMNLSHAVAVVLYAVQDKEEKERAPRRVRKELERTFIKLLPTEQYAEGRAEAFAQLLNRMPPRPEEASSLLGALKDIESEMEND